MTRHHTMALFIRLLPLILWEAARIAGESFGHPVAMRFYSGNPSSWPQLLAFCTTITTTLGPALIVVGAGVLFRAGVGPIFSVNLAAFGLVASGVFTLGQEVVRLWPYMQGGYIHGSYSGLGLLVSDAARPGVWVSLLLSVLVSLALLVAFTRAPRKFRLSNKNEPVKRLESGPWKADWMPIKEAWEKFSADNGLILGEAYRPDETPKLAGKADLLRWAPKGHLLTCSGSGGGKGISIVVPNALTWAGPLVINDPAGETLEMVRATRKSMGRKIRVLTLDPSTDGMNVLGTVDPNGDRLIEDVRTIVEWMAFDQGGKSSENEEFKAGGKNLLTCLALYLVTAPQLKPELRTLKQLRKLVTQPDLKEFLKLLVKKPEFSGLAHGAVGNLASGVLSVADSDKTWAGVVWNAEVYTAFLMSPAKDRLLSGAVPPAQLFDPRDLLRGDTDFFICLPVTALETEPQVARVILGTLLTTIYNTGRRVHDTLFLLDEMPRLGQMKILKTARDFGRKYGIIIWAIIQDLGQLEEAWGQDGARGWIATPIIRQFFGIGDLQTAEMLSKMIGNFTARTESVSQNTGDNRNPGQVGVGRSAGYGKNEQGQQVALIEPSDVLAMATDEDGVPDEQIILIRNQRPLRCGMAKYWRRPELAGMAEKSSFYKRG